MRDIWGVLLQTLTASGAAILLLAIKALFRDKLTPRWQFASWSVLAVVMLLPAGLGGRYVLVNWPMVVEVLKTLAAGEYSITHVTAPVALVTHAPETVWDWLFLVYAAGTIFLLAGYLFSYLRLRLALHRGRPADAAMMARIADAAQTYGLKPCSAVVVPGLSSAFVCGIFHPVLALPEGETDDKVLLHELLHRSHHDTVWSVVLCLFRCLHWCNPLLWYCANQAGNDLEALCDQRVLEHLEGEERRDYGRILLSMASEKYARAVGTSSMANGGKNIRRRIEAIARFRRYPAGMGLVSVCVVLVLMVNLTVGSGAAGVSRRLGEASFAETGSVDGQLNLRLAQARSVPCTTMAGALDTYGKALLTKNAYYRVMCLPEEEQEAFAASLGNRPVWDIGLDVRSWADAEYYLYNPVREGKSYTYTMVIRQWLEEDRSDMPEDEPEHIKIGIQRVRAQKEGGRWVVRPQEEMRTEICEEASLYWGELGLPSIRYTAEGADFRVIAHHMVILEVDNQVTEQGFLGYTSYFDVTAKPDARFDQMRRTTHFAAEYLGDRPETLTSIGLSTGPLYSGEEEPELEAPPEQEEAVGSGSSGSHWSSRSLHENWGPTVFLGGGGGSAPYTLEKSVTVPEAFAADLYLNGEKAAELTLLPEEVDHD